MFLRQGRGARGATVHEVITGPFADAPRAVLRGLALRRDPRFAKAGLRLRELAVLLPTSFLPLPIQVDEETLARFNPGKKRPYPALGELLVARAPGFAQPAATLPAAAHVRVTFSPWQPLLVLGEQEVCGSAGPQRRCLRWFEVLEPRRIRSAWVPAHQLRLHRDRKRYEVAEGDGTTRATGSLWRIGRDADGVRFAVALRRGTLPPQRFTVTLDAAQAPPFRLVVDRHGPGVYNQAGRVVARIELGAWQYEWPPLWRRPERLKRRERRKRR